MDNLNKAFYGGVFMEFEIKSFLELNLIADAVLLLIFSFTVLLRNPKFLILLVALNLCQYVLWIPDTEILRAHQKLQEKHHDSLDNKSAAREQESGSSQKTNVGALNSGDPVRVGGQVVNIYDNVLQGMGAGAGSASMAMEFSLDAWKKNLSESQTDNEKGFSYSPIDVLIQAGQGDLHASWFMIRFFWLAATFYLYMQRPQVGVVVFALNLVPVPFLAHFIPYLWFRFNEQTWVKDLNTWAQLGTLPKETADFLVFHSVTFVVLALPLFLVLVAALSQWRSTKDNSLRDYLNPTRFDLLMNGTRIPFEVNGNNLLAGDFLLNIRHLSYDPDNPKIWYLKTGTKVEFVEKSTY